MYFFAALMHVDVIVKDGKECTVSNLKDNQTLKLNHKGPKYVWNPSLKYTPLRKKIYMMTGVVILLAIVAAIIYGVL